MESLEQNSAASVNAKRVEFSDVQYTISPFSGDDLYRITKWLDDFERVMDSVDGNARHRLLFCRRLCTGSAAILLRTITANTYEELKKQLMLDFNRKIDRHNVYVQFASRRIKKDDGLQQYILNTQALAIHADIEESELIRFILEGMLYPCFTRPVVLLT